MAKKKVAKKKVAKKKLAKKKRPAPKKRPTAKRSKKRAKPAAKRQRATTATKAAPALPRPAKKPPRQKAEVLSPSIVQPEKHARLSVRSVHEQRRIDEVLAKVYVVANESGEN